MWPALAHVPLAIGAVIMVAPFIYMFAKSITPLEDVFAPGQPLFPNNPTFEPYVNAFSAQIGLGRALLNSVVVTVPVTIGTVLSCSMAGFAFARLEFRGSAIWFGAIIATLMIPVQVKLISLYVGFAYIGLLDTYWPLILPGVLNNAFGVFLMKQYFMTIPRSLDEAAEIDGANPWQVFWRIAAPQARPAMAALGLFTFLGTWNDFFGPLIFLSSPELFTAPVAVARAVGLYGTDWSLLMAASTIAIVPSVITFFILRRRIVDGVSFTGVNR